MKELGNNTKKAHQTSDQTPVIANENDPLIIFEGVESALKLKAQET
jgi:hypothetical protein